MNMKLKTVAHDDERRLKCHFCGADFLLKSSKIPLVKVTPMGDPDTVLRFGKYADCPACNRGNVFGI